MILNFRGLQCCFLCGSRVSAAGWSRVGGGAAGGVGEVGDAELDRVGAAGGDLLHLGEFGAGAGEADLEALGLAVPAVGLGFGDPGDEVAADLFEAWAGGGIGSQQRAAQTAVFVDAGGVVGAAAVADGDLAVFEVADELGPFLVGRGAVFLGGAQCAAAGDVCAVAVDHLVGVDRLVSHGGVDVAVAGDELGDVWWHAVHDRVGDEQPAEIVEGVAHGASGGVLDADRGEGVIKVG